MRSDVVTIGPIGLTSGHAGWHLFTEHGITAWAGAELGGSAPPVMGWHIPTSEATPSPTAMCRLERQTAPPSAAGEGTTWWPGVPAAAAAEEAGAADGAADDGAVEDAEEPEAAGDADVAEAADDPYAAAEEPEAAEEPDAEADEAPPICRHQLQPMST